MAAAVLSPTINISGSGTAVATYLGTVNYQSEPDRYGNYYIETYDKWQIVCTPGAGWYMASLSSLSRATVWFKAYSTGTEYSSTNDFSFPPNNVSPPASHTQSFTVASSSAVGAPTWHRDYDGTSTLKNEWKWTAWTVNVNFYPNLFGDKLICDPDRGNKLCYDVTTGKLLYGGV